MMEKYAALYIRVSLEDDDLKCSAEKTESNSITNQRKFLREYVAKNEELSGYPIKEYYDDGYTGRNFDRPGFRALITACRENRITVIIVKDLSRLGRNYVEVGNLLEQLFPFLGVRLISVNDGYDSEHFSGQTGGIDIAFKNLVYNLYSRDLSQKVTTAVRTRMKKGEYTSTYPIFGYNKSSDDIHKLVVDEEAGAIVRRIFEMVIANVGRTEIARILNEENVPTPAVYKQKKGCSRDWCPDGKKSGWCSSMIAKIIRDERYAGNMVSHKRVYEAFDSKKQIDVPKEDWIIVENTHEGIVSHEEFAQANANMRNVKGSSRKGKAANKQTFSIITCPYCGLRLRPGSTKAKYMYCSNRSNHVNSRCATVRIEKEMVKKTLVELVRKQAELILTAEELLKEKNAVNKSDEDMESTIKRLKAEKKRLDDVKIHDYENYKSGCLSREDFLEAKKSNDDRRHEIENAISSFEAQLALQPSVIDENSPALEIKKYIHLEQYDKKVMAALIDKAVVVDEKTIYVVWKYQDVYDKFLSQLK